MERRYARSVSPIARAGLVIQEIDDADPCRLRNDLRLPAADPDDIEPERPFHARMTRTALEAFHDKTGVCRDYTHLAVAFCRCMNIPARYCTGYLGDIGVPPPHGTPDFAAWFEAFLGGHWHTFDARNNIPRIGRVLIARGRDASDVALSSTFGPNKLTSFRVWTDEVRAA